MLGLASVRGLKTPKAFDPAIFSDIMDSYANSNAMITADTEAMMDSEVWTPTQPVGQRGKKINFTFRQAFFNTFMVAGVVGHYQFVEFWS